MQIAPDYGYERKNVFEWTPFDYLHWLRNVQDYEEFNGNFETQKFIKQMGDALFSKIKRDVGKRNNKRG